MKYCIFVEIVNIEVRGSIVWNELMNYFGYVEFESFCNLFKRRYLVGSWK